MRSGHRLSQVLWSAVQSMHALYSYMYRVVVQTLQFSIEGIP